MTAWLARDWADREGQDADRVVASPAAAEPDRWADPEWVSGKAMVDYLRGHPWPAPELDPDPEPEAEL